MKETILITGAGPNGITGRRIKERIEDLKEYNVLSPSSKELNLISKYEVDRYFRENSIDYIIHSAVVSPSRGHDNSEPKDEIENNLRMYFNLASHFKDFKKMFVFGSGAEYDKSKDIINVKEIESDICIPNDKYGFVKFIIHRHVLNSSNIYNLRLFGTLNPLEPPTRNVVSNICAKITLGLPVVLKRDCRFSFVDIDDVADFIIYGIKNNLQFHVYNLISDSNLLLSEIVRKAQELASLKGSPSFIESGLNKEYTGNNNRWKNEFSNLTTIEESIKKVLEEMKRKKNTIDISELDHRWKNKK